MSAYKDKPNHTTPKADRPIRDPGNIPWVITGVFFLIGMMPPVFPLEGTWLGIPLWALWVVGISTCLALFTCYVIFLVWCDAEETDIFSQQTKNPDE